MFYRGRKPETEPPGKHTGKEKLLLTRRNLEQDHPSESQRRKRRGKQGKERERDGERETNMQT